MVRTLIALALLAHGIGHVLFAGNSWGTWRTEPSRAGLFTKVLHVGQDVEGVMGLIWLVPMIGFMAVAWGLYVQAAWWQQAALISAGTSTILMLLWWGSLNESSAMLALLFDLAVIGTVLLQPALVSP
jgi:hypothetical protein